MKKLSFAIVLLAAGFSFANAQTTKEERSEAKAEVVERVENQSVQADVATPQMQTAQVEEMKVEDMKAEQIKAEQKAAKKDATVQKKSVMKKQDAATKEKVE